MAGLTTAGFTLKTLQTILFEIQQAQRDRIDPSINNATTTPLGQNNGIFSERESLLWELLRLAYLSYDPDSAEGWLLDILCSLTGTSRRASTRTLVAGVVNLDGGTFLPAGSTSHVDGQATRLFRTRTDVDATAVLVAADYPVVFEAVETGPLQVNANTLTEIAGPVAGWNSVTNPTDGVTGRNIETDTELRVRRNEEIQKVGGSTPDAIRADLIDIDGVITAHVFENISDTTDPVSGLPAFAIEVLVFDGVVPTVADDVIAQTIWNSAPAGSRFYGSNSGTAIDSEGNNQTVLFSRPVVKPVWITAIVTRAPGVTAPGNAADLLRDHLVDTANEGFTSDGDVVALLMRAILLDSKKDLGYDWVYDVPTLLLGFSVSPAGTANLTITPREIARLDTSRTAITLT